MKVDFKELSKSRGYKKLKKAVLFDCTDRRHKKHCFNVGGCRDKDPSVRCFHDYCYKFKWVIDRAKHYSYKTGISIVEILNNWEDDRSYWYMNYYQESNQPKLTGNSVLVLDSIDELKKLAENGFRCPRCGGISTDPYRCNSGKNVNSKSGVCDWAVYGFFGDLGKGLYIFVRGAAKGERIFMPISYEKSLAGKP